MKWIVLLLIIAGVAGYFTRPEEAVMREAANAVLSDPQSVSEGFESVATTLAGDRAYDNYYVAAKYNVTLDNQPVVTCWGAFTQVQCNRAADTRTGG
ncbi:hypothetical protein [Candidatus Viadribacter manganicus]|uniref:DUF4359 domain-containing protein n=1 Tax=Candidatus Viadribacter manganicus TaxID=1759059 RepID=A0A1B1AFA2_9PROT|nr:hypothetical protein [Candidatus Viadribacter manganicus]ANP45224.1 hypothetical protein ATE48_04470 [Candidatus Viadribacter manganicus]